MLDRREVERWYRQAEHTMASADHDREAGDYAWACFKAHQAAEFAVKALLRALGKVATGHGLLALLDRLHAEGVTSPDTSRDAARRLDLHYIPSRYPDAFPVGAPFEYYGAGEAEKALADARSIIEWVRRVVADA